MASLIAQGTLIIELVDVFNWLAKESALTSDCRRVYFSVSDDALCVELVEGGVHEVDAADMWRWVVSSQLPAGLSDCETIFGVPRVVGSDLHITFAADSGGDPRNWATPPACLSEWRAARGSAA